MEKPSNDPEEWRDIQGYEGLYQVSNLGRVKSLDKTIVMADGRNRHQKEKILKLQINKWILCNHFMEQQSI